MVQIEIQMGVIYTGNDWREKGMKVHITYVFAIISCYLNSKLELRAKHKDLLLCFGTGSSLHLGHLRSTEKSGAALQLVLEAETMAVAYRTCGSSKGLM